MEKVDVLSGIQPTGLAHIGNYLGALRNWVSLQESKRCFYCVVDLHALTTLPKGKELRRSSLEMAKVLMACGVDPERSALFLQSAVPGHTDLAWAFQCMTPMGDLSRMTQFKDKSADQPKNINAGLFTYPVLQAADILIYRAGEVPVGEDQVQHLELAREIARRFNRTYRNLFPEPQPCLTKAPRILGLDGTKKMSKSQNNHIPLLATPPQLQKLVGKAVTDPQRVRRDDPGRPEICNVFSLHGHFSRPEEVQTVETDCRSAALGCVDCKRRLAENMAQSLEPIRTKAEALEQEPERLLDALSDGAKRAGAVAKHTMDKVRNATGLA
ncbi:MAG: tryptophan--tRNA ligase [Planctomycetota bacterium]|nr:MAG: tryptophan--tRNA ligase [Planctomycetota bacterium]